MLALPITHCKVSGFTTPVLSFHIRNHDEDLLLTDIYF